MAAAAAAREALIVFIHFHADNDDEGTAGQQYIGGTIEKAETKQASRNVTAKKEGTPQPVPVLREDGSNAGQWAAGVKTALSTVPVPLMPTYNVHQILTGEITLREYHNAQAA